MDGTFKIKFSSFSFVGVVFIGSLSNGVGKKQINFYIAPVDFPLELFCYQ